MTYDASQFWNSSSAILAGIAFGAVAMLILRRLWRGVRSFPGQQLQSLPQQHASEYRYARDIPSPDRLMLSTRPYLIGSSPLAKAIGIVEVGGERP